MSLMLLVVAAGCSDDDDDEMMGGSPEAVAEDSLNTALSEIIGPVFELYGFISGTLNPVANAPNKGIACPDTSGVCNPGSVSCSVGLGFDFDFMGCGLFYDDALHTIDGDINLAPDSSGVLATLTGVVIDGSPGISGTFLATESKDCGVLVNISADDGTVVVGDLVGCEDEPDASSDMQITLATVNGIYVAFIDFDGTATASANVFDGEELVAVCGIDLDTLVASCS